MIGCLNSYADRFYSVKMRRSSSSSAHYLIRSIFFIFGLIVAAAGGKRRVHISDDLADVVDNEEDEEWKEWGKKKTSPLPDAPPKDLSNMEYSEIQGEMRKYQTGPAFGFVKLRLGTRRTPDTVLEIANKWIKVARTGGLEVSFIGVDISTIMFNMEKGQDSLELKDFILTQSEAYEVKIGNELYRRPGDPPFDDVFEKYRAANVEEDSTQDNNSHKEDEL